MKTLFLIRGVSGSGKTTLASSLTDWVLSADDFFYDEDGGYRFDQSMIDNAHKVCQAHVECGMSQMIDKIAVSNTFTTVKEMQPYFDLAKEYGYKVVSLIVENRHSGVNVHGVPEEVLVKQEDRLRQSIKLR